MKKSTKWIAKAAVRKTYKAILEYKAMYPTDTAWVNAGGTMKVLCSKIARKTGVDYRQVQAACKNTGLTTQLLWDLFGTHHDNDYDFDIIDLVRV